MNLAKLFEVQKVLRDRINYNEPDRFNKLVLALLVELGECANEWQGFKFWKQDCSPKKYYKNVCKVDGLEGQCGPDLVNPYTKVLEEYVDGLHFVLELGIEIGEPFYVPLKRICLVNDVTRKFNSIFRLVSELDESTILLEPTKYLYVMTEYVELGEMLGFTWEQIESAYMEKNKVNHQRQEQGY